MFATGEKNQFSDCPIVVIRLRYEDVKGERCGVFTLAPTIDETIDFAVNRLVQQMRNGIEIYPLKAEEEELD